MQKIKVLYAHTLPVISGSGLAAFLMMKGLDKNKYEVEFATAPGGPLIDKIEEIGIKVHMIKKFVQPINIFKDILALFELILLVKKQKYKIVHTHNSKAGFIGRLAAKISGVPIIVHTIHGFAFHDFENPFRKKLFMALEKFAARFTDKLFVISTPLKEWGLKVGVGVPEQYIINYDGIEIEKFQKEFSAGGGSPPKADQPTAGAFCAGGASALGRGGDKNKIRQEFHIKPDDKVVGMVGKLWDGKGHIYLLEAAKQIIEKIPNAKFMIVGDGYLRNELERKAADLGISNNVIFTGFREDIPEITASFDIACLPSLFEGMGRVLLEAQLLGKPVVATNVGGIPELVEDGITGILVPPANSNALAKAIITLLTDNALLNNMSIEARQFVTSKFSDKEMVRKIDMVYEELISKKLVRT